MGLCGWLSGKNEILVEENRGLSDYELTISLRGSKILQTYQFRDEISRQTKSVGNIKMIGSDEPDLESREDFLVYMRDSHMKLGNGLRDQTRWGAQRHTATLENGRMVKVATKRAKWRPLDISI